MPLMLKSASDNLISMKKTMTATEVARNFSAVLDAVASGNEIEITRGKVVVAVLIPDPQKKTVARMMEAFKERHAKYGPMDDETYAIYQEILEERHAPYNLVGGEFDRDPWER
jgi:antitoxin (DNA-binding transcriptional repressor) of toxin-antitoxin stability system